MTRRRRRQARISRASRARTAPTALGARVAAHSGDRGRSVAAICGRHFRPNPVRATPKLAAMTSHTAYMTFRTESRRELIRITEDVQAAVDEAGIAEGLVLVSAMHITAGVWVNDDEPGLHADTLEWLDKVAPPSWQEPANDVARELLPDPGDYRHHRGGEDNGDAHLKNLLIHHQAIVPVT